MSPLAEISNNQKKLEINFSIQRNPGKITFLVLPWMLYWSLGHSLKWAPWLSEQWQDISMCCSLVAVVVLESSGISPIEQVRFDPLLYNNNGVKINNGLKPIQLCPPVLDPWFQQLVASKETCWICQGANQRGCAVVFTSPLTSRLCSQLQELQELPTSP